jgi:ferredoxin
MISIDADKCLKCNTCTQYCPAGLIREGPELGEETIRYCVSCGQCFAVCPAEAISVVGCKDIKIPPFSETHGVSSDAVETLLRRRRSIRHYKAGPVSRIDMEKILEAASLVPSAHNWRKTKAYVCSNHKVISQIHAGVTDYYRRLMQLAASAGMKLPEEIPEEIKFAIDRLVVNPPAGTDHLFWDAETLLVFTSTYPHPLCIGDAWMASFAAVIYAATIKVGTCYNGFLIMGLNDDVSIKTLMGIPESEVVVTALTLGYFEEKHLRYPPRGIMETIWV